MGEFDFGGEFGGLAEQIRDIGATGGSFGAGDAGLGYQPDVTPNVAPSGGFGFKDIASGAKEMLPFLSAGTGLLGLGAGIQGAAQMGEQNKIARQGLKLQQQAAQKTQEAAAPLTAFGTQELGQAAAGAIPPAIQAKIEEWKTGAKQRAQDYAARSGQGDSQMLAQWLAWIDQQGKAMEANYLQEEQQLGVQGLQAGAGALTQAGGTASGVSQNAMNQSNAIENLMSQANATLSRLTAAAA